jgi:hypothetical protein
MGSGKDAETFPNMPARQFDFPFPQPLPPAQAVDRMAVPLKEC